MGGGQGLYWVFSEVNHFRKLPAGIPSALNSLEE